MMPAPKLSKLGRSALMYAAQYGWRVFPLHSIDNGACTCGDVKCTGTKPGKHPRTPKGCLDATTDTGVIRGWWERWPDANVGIATGGGLVVIDVDPRHGGDDGLVDLRRTLGDLPDTVECLTGSGGRHIYVSVGEGVTVRNSAGTLAPGVDIRGEGGYVVAAPSVHTSGRSYTWEASSRPDEVEVAPMPPAWLEAIVKRPKLRVIAGGSGEAIVEGGRNETLFRRAASMRAAGFEEPAILAAILAENETRCSPPLDPAEVKGIVSSVCRYAPGLSAEYEAKRAEAAARKAEAKSDGETKVEGEWSDELYRTPKGAVKNTFANLCTILRRAPEYATLRFNEMAVVPEINGAQMTDAQLGLVREAIERAYGFSPGADALSQAIVAVSSERSHHPVREYLGGLVWDRLARLDTVCERIIHAEATPINVTVVRAWFIAAVARAMKPGCKVDTALVFVGPQGCFKSTFFRVLAGRYFSDTAVDIESKDAMMQINGAWIYELGELDHVTSRAHAGRLKAFVTSQVDKYRPPFARAVLPQPRSNVIVGSTNEDQFLNDPTGDRRFHCVRINGRVDIGVLAEERDQLWAEAVVAYNAGEAWWLTQEAEAALRESSEAFRVVDPWEGAVSTWLDAPKLDAAKAITSQRILVDVLGMRLQDVDQKASNRLAAIMRRLGWRNRVARVEGGAKVARVWEPAP
ncbi:MAG: VapE domain-containing protein [Fusobacteriaceae bacterium]